MTAGAAILEALYAADGFVAVAELERRARDIGGEVAELQRLGYTIEVHPHLGYRLVNTPDRLMADDLKARIGTQTIGSEILVFNETTSTNDVVERLASTQTGEGLVVFAESQTAGRGRHGRAWESARGKGLWFSVMLRPKMPAASFSRITVAASVAVARAVRQTDGLDARIKWPNDVVLSGRKLAGILTEVRRVAASVPDAKRFAAADAAGTAAATPAVAILGIGLNVNQQAGDFPAALREHATSLRIATGQDQDRAALAARVLRELERYYRQAHADFDAVSTEWAGLCVTLGKQLVVRMGAHHIEGLAHALNGDGALLLRRDNGHVEEIVGGDVVVER